MNFIWDLIDAVELTEYAREYDVEFRRADAMFLLDSYLPDTKTLDLEFRLRLGGMNDVDVAEYRAWDTPAPMTDRPGFSYISGEIGPLSRQIPLSEEERLRRDALLRQTNDPLIDMIYSDAERMVRSVAARVEMARGDLIDDGKVTINENGVNVEADFGRSSVASPSAGTVWSNTGAATPLSNLLGWVEDYVDLNGFEPGEILIPRSTVMHLALNAEFRSYLAASGTTPTRLNAEAIAAVMAAEGLPPFRIYDGQFRVRGVRTKVLNPEKIYMMPPSGVAYGETRWGVTAEATVMQGRGLRVDPPGIVSLVYGNDHPVQTSVVATAVSMPITPNVDYVFDITVLSL